MTDHEKNELLSWYENLDVRRCKRLSMVFYALLTVLDIAGYPFSRWFVSARIMPERNVWLFLVTVYTASVFGWIFLTRLSKLLLNLGMAEVFIDENVRYMQVMARCCLYAGAVCAVSAVYYLPFLIVAPMMVLTALIIRIVADVFRQAIAMKAELDLTV